ncbi:hypothetical protein [Psychroflexus sp. MES1-P1E]|jgi:hypothetical protein|uniref:hypothetical protein n=1 Tax=Psychroflexus sp. MES1-P1E TaxID=2058320 RepID=UPI000C7C14D9|nr:hypothetical protein [Psychroflexus sp. MES1-P1E]PKG42623.1 hypothetical protein CXF67_09285 [Psychroflexus sp. MES1-P1E]
MELKPEIGIGNLKFGMKRTEVENILGKPDAERIDKDNENRLILVFNNEKLRLTFYESENKRLGYIETSNSNLTFNGIKILNTNIDFAKKDILGQIMKEWELEEYHSFSTHFNDKYWLTLHSEFETVTNLELGVPFENDEDYKWPN